MDHAIASARFQRCLRECRRGLYRFETRRILVFLAWRAHRQRERAFTGDERERNGLRRRPEQRPIGRGHCDTDTMAFRKRIAAINQRHTHLVLAARHQLCWLAGAVWHMRKIQRAVGDARRSAIRCHIAQPHADERHRPVHGQRQFSRGRPEDLDRLRERPRIKAQRLAVVGALVAGHFRAGTVLEPRHQFTDFEAQRLWRQVRELRGLSRPRAERATGIEKKLLHLDALVRPFLLRDPASRRFGIPALCRYRLRHPCNQLRLAHDPGVLAAHPVVVPAQRFLQETDRGSRHPEVRKAVAPGADQAFGR